MERCFLTLQIYFDTVDNGMLRFPAVERYHALCFQNRVPELLISVFFPNLALLARQPLSVGLIVEPQGMNKLYGLFSCIRIREHVSELNVSIQFRRRPPPPVCMWTSTLNDESKNLDWG